MNDEMLANILRRFLLSDDPDFHAWWYIHPDALSLDGNCELTPDESRALWALTDGRADSLGMHRVREEFYR